MNSPKSKALHKKMGKKEHPDSLPIHYTGKSGTKHHVGNKNYASGGLMGEKKFTGYSWNKKNLKNYEKDK